MPSVAAAEGKAVVLREFIFDRAPFSQCHASTLAETPEGLVVAWFGGRREKNPDVGIWLSRQTVSGWTVPVEVANGAQPDGRRFPTWNPVLFRAKQGPLTLFYKVGPDPAHWWGMAATSSDHGRHWESPIRMPAGTIGPAKNKPIELPDGTLLSPSSREAGAWRVQIERRAPADDAWQLANRIPGSDRYRAIQPTLLAYPTGRLQLLARSREDRIVKSWSDDDGRQWSELSETMLLNPNSGIDAVMLRDGRALLVYNPTRWRRSPLVVAISVDGDHWQPVLTLEKGAGEYSYPAVIQTRDGRVHITYTWKRERIRHVVLDPDRLSR